MTEDCVKQCRKCGYPYLWKKDLDDLELCSPYICYNCVHLKHIVPGSHGCDSIGGLKIMRAIKSGNTYTCENCEHMCLNIIDPKYKPLVKPDLCANCSISGNHANKLSFIYFSFNSLFFSFNSFMCVLSISMH
jgi:hypothetical protein